MSINDSRWGFLRRIDLKCMSTCYIWCLIAPIWSFGHFNSQVFSIMQYPLLLFNHHCHCQYLLFLFGLFGSSTWYLCFCTAPLGWTSTAPSHKKSEVFCLGIHDNLLRIPTSVPNPSIVVIEKWLVTQKSRASWWPPFGCVSKSNLAHIYWLPTELLEGSI